MILAGLCAGLATQFKFIFVAAAAAGVVWLLIQRQWSNLARFAVSAALASIVPYLLFSFREPRMLSQVLALSSGIVDVFGDLAFIARMPDDLVVVLAMFGLPPGRPPFLATMGAPESPDRGQYGHAHSGR